MAAILFGPQCVNWDAIDPVYLSIFHPVAIKLATISLISIQFRPWIFLFEVLTHWGWDKMAAIS